MRCCYMSYDLMAAGQFQLGPTNLSLWFTSVITIHNFSCPSVFLHTQNIATVCWGGFSLCTGTLIVHHNPMTSSQHKHSIYGTQFLQHKLAGTWADLHPRCGGCKVWKLGSTFTGLSLSHMLTSPALCGSEPGSPLLEEVTVHSSRTLLLPFEQTTQSEA